MATPPTGTHTPARPETVTIEQPRLFAASIIEDLGAWRHQWSRDMTRGVLAWISRMFPTRPAVVAVGAYVAVTMGGQLRSTATAAQIAGEMGLTPQAVKDSLSRLYRAGVFEAHGRGRGRVILPGPVLRLSIETSPSQPPEARTPARNRRPGATDSTNTRAQPSPGGDAPETSNHHQSAREAENRAEPLRLPWETDVPCPQCGTGRLAIKPRTGELDAVCKDCRAAQRAAATMTPAPDRGPERCTRCGGPNRTNGVGQFLDPCDACAGPAGGQ